MGQARTIEGVRAAVLPDDLRERLGLSADDLVDVSVTAHRAGTKRNIAALDDIIAKAHKKASKAGVTAENCTDFLYDEHGLPA